MTNMNYISVCPCFVCTFTSQQHHFKALPRIVDPVLRFPIYVVAVETPSTEHMAGSASRPASHFVHNFSRSPYIVRGPHVLYHSRPQQVKALKPTPGTATYASFEGGCGYRRGCNASRTKHYYTLRDQISNSWSLSRDVRRGCSWREAYVIYIYTYIYTHTFILYC